MDSEDHIRVSSNKSKLLAALKLKGVLTNHQARFLGGSRALGRIHELIKEGHPITVRKLKGSTWEIRYNLQPLGRDAQTRQPTKRRASPQQEGLFSL